MEVNYISFSDAQLYKTLLTELRPDWELTVIEDYNLNYLEFADEPVCSLTLNTTEEEIMELYNEIIALSAELYVFEDMILEKNDKISDNEQDLLNELNDRYSKFAPLEWLCLEILSNIKNV